MNQVSAKSESTVAVPITVRSYTNCTQQKWDGSFFGDCLGDGVFLSRSFFGLTPLRKAEALSSNAIIRKAFISDIDRAALISDRVVFPSLGSLHTPDYPTFEIEESVAAFLVSKHDDGKIRPISTQFRSLFSFVFWASCKRSPSPRS